MESATIFAIGIGVFAAMELGERLVSGIGRLAKDSSWLAKRAGETSGVRDDFYVFYRLSDLTGAAPLPARSRAVRPAAGVRRPQPRLSQSC